MSGFGYGANLGTELSPTRAFFLVRLAVGRRLAVPYKEARRP
jgi:hypothetical protein